MHKRILFIFFFFIVSCSNKYQVYEKTGFAGISKNNKIISYLQKDSLIKITNKNNKISKVYKVDEQLKSTDSRIIYLPEIVYNEISLNREFPLVLVQSMRENKSFIAKKAKTFDEEKNINKKVNIETIEVLKIDNEKVITKKIFLDFGPFYYKTYSETLFRLLSLNIKNKKLIYKDYAPKNHIISIGPLKNLTEYDNIYLKLGKIGLIGFNIRVQ
ncbi:MAG: hypothetical protein MRY23_04320 [Pelagibacteraceae bacterium]|nr:hypothetical protein [Pelagibacteraceae bacterium]MCI5079194.1 hypothetical protein [Pelagibacteraceae bacterium]